MLEVLNGILIPFIGTVLGSSCVLFMRKAMNIMIQRALTGFAAGVMVAASVWSLLIPSMDYSESMGRMAFIPAAVGFLGGIAFLLILDHVIPHLHMNSSQAEGPKSHLKKTTMLLMAVTLHNIPEGMAVGVVYAGYLSENIQINAMAAAALSIGIAIQAIKAAELAEQGKSAQEIMNFLNEISPKVRTSFIVKDLNYLKMGGRCSSLQAFAGSLLNIKPKIHLENGFVLAGENFRGSREKIVQKLIESSASDLPNIDMDTILLAHAFASDRDVQIAKDCLLSLMPNIKNLIVTTTGGVISSHCGPETVGLVYKLK